MANFSIRQSLHVLIENASSTDFHQWLYIMDRFFPELHICLQADTQYEFPTSDIRYAKAMEKHIDLYCAFDGLYGVDGYMHLIEKNIQRFLLNLCATRFYQLRHQAWLQNRPYLSYGKHAVYLQYVSAFSGYLPDCIKMHSVLGYRWRNRVGLTRLLTHCFPIFTFNIHVHSLKWHPIEACTSGPVLGNVLLGTRYLSVFGNLRIDIQPSNALFFTQIMLLKDLLTQVNRAVQQYVGCLFNAIYRFFWVPQIAPLKLDGLTAHLGFHTSLGRPLGNWLVFQDLHS